MNKDTKPEAPTGNLKFGTKKHVAQLLSVCARSVDNLLAQGMPHLKIGERRVRFDLDEVHAWAKREFSTRRMGKVSAK